MCGDKIETIKEMIKKCKERKTEIKNTVDVRINRIIRQSVHKLIKRYICLLYKNIYFSN